MALTDSTIDEQATKIYNNENSGDRLRLKCLDVVFYHFFAAKYHQFKPKLALTIINVVSLKELRPLIT